jgi:nucleoid-associated protein YgaU
VLDGGPRTGIIEVMTERTAPDAGTLACPFVAFEDDRDERSEAPDHRHRCYADVRPAPRAIAHQEAFCLSGAFATCPTFQDWARREAARARAAAAAGGAADSGDEDDQPARNPPRDWSAPPPWVGDPGAPRPESEPVAPAFLTRTTRPPTDDGLPVDAAGLSASRWLDDGSKADAPRALDPDDEELARALAADQAARERLALDRGAAGTGSPSHGVEAAAIASASAGIPATEASSDRSAAEGAPSPAAASGTGGSSSSGGRRRGAPAQARPVSSTRRRPVDHDLVGPAWEQPRHYEAYPTIRTRMGLPSVPRLALAALAIVVAAGVLFAVPFLLKSGGDGGATAPSAMPPASAAASADLSSAEPVPTVVVYVVKSGDTMSKIAKKYGVTVDQILAVNKAIKNPNKIKPGDEVTIPAPLPSEITNGGSSAAP